MSSTDFHYLPKEILDKEVDRHQFPFSQQLFWDSPIHTIDMETHKNYIIEHVITRGLLADFYLLLKIYTCDEITTALKKSKSLDRKTVQFCSDYFNIPLSELHASSFLQLMLQRIIFYNNFLKNT